MLKVELRIDWLTVTDTGGEQVTSLYRAVYVANELLNRMGLQHTLYPIPGSEQRFYKYSLEYASGLTVSVAENLAQQGVKATMSGSFLSTVDTDALVDAIYAEKLGVTRMDIAIDIYDGGFSIEGIAEAYKKGHVGRKRVTTFIDGATGGTFYVGSRQSEKMLRIYDKAGEQGQEGDRKRLEMEFKGAAAYAALEIAYKRQFGLFAGEIRAFYGAPGTPIDTLLEKIEIPGRVKPVQEETDGLGWWIKSVRPALEKLKRLDAEKYKTVIDILTSD